MLTLLANPYGAGASAANTIFFPYNGALGAVVSLSLEQEVCHVAAFPARLCHS